MQTRRLRHSILLLALFSLLLPACGVKEPLPVTITYYRRGYVEGGEDAASQKARLIVASFQKRYPPLHEAVVENAVRRVTPTRARHHTQLPHRLKL